MKTSICEVVRNPGSFDGKIIELRADVLAGLESNALYDKSCRSRGKSATGLLFVESKNVPRTSEYLKFWNLVQAYKEPEGKRHSIIPDKYTVTATVAGRYEAASPSRPEIRPSGQLVLESVRDVVARPFDNTFFSGSDTKSSAKQARHP
ncbi:MAG: hypothetical protein LAO22_17220 [Acidobacteriia bacterium]|nr:hypothetical protein [Terriglobia bacterium]